MWFPALVGLFFMYGLLSLAAVVGNAVVLIVIYSLPHQNNCSYLFFNLAISDFIIALITIPFQMQAAILQKWYVLPLISITRDYVKIIIKLRSTSTPGNPHHERDIQLERNKDKVYDLQKLRHLFICLEAFCIHQADSPTPSSSAASSPAANRCPFQGTSATKPSASAPSSSPLLSLPAPSLTITAPTFHPVKEIQDKTTPSNLPST
ncbi:tkr-3 [Cordylochernes scorpioides]|uniref:Tkr-3 n=1 Tax=Cordylochernes scorpioides TaxID=51811 RepID=A0ABY6LVC3_9ARAC|nr:tkr-3 [Cordylochernes scorpioides]